MSAFKNDTKLAVSIVDFLCRLRDSGSHDTESLDVAIQCLSEALLGALSESDRSALSAGARNYPLEIVFEKGLAQLEEQTDSGRWQTYLSSLEQHGFFRNAERGTREYEERMEKARAKYMSKFHSETETKSSSADEKLDAPMQPSEEDKQTAEAHKKRANEFLEKKKTDEAIAEYTKAIQLNPNNHIYFANRAAAYLSQNNFEKAVEDNDVAIRLEPSYTKAWYRQGRAYAALNKHQEAVNCFQQASQLSKGDKTMLDSIAPLLRDSQSRLDRAAASSQSAGANAANPVGIDFGSLLSDPQMQAMLRDPSVMQMASQFLSNAMGSPSQPQAQAQSQPQSQPQPQQQPQGGQQGWNQMLSGLMNDPEFAELKSDPVMAPIIADIEKNGPAVALKYVGNPAVMSKLQGLLPKFQQSRRGGGGAPGST